VNLVKSVMEKAWEMGRWGDEEIFRRLFPVQEGYN
jgi:hypothetical protein